MARGRVASRVVALGSGVLLAAVSFCAQPAPAALLDPRGTSLGEDGEFAALLDGAQAIAYLAEAAVAQAMAELAAIPSPLDELLATGRSADQPDQVPQPSQPPQREPGWPHDHALAPGSGNTMGSTGGPGGTVGHSCPPAALSSGGTVPQLHPFARLAEQPCQRLRCLGIRPPTPPPRGEVPAR